MPQRTAKMADKRQKFGLAQNMYQTKQVKKLIV